MLKSIQDLRDTGGKWRKSSTGAAPQVSGTPVADQHQPSSAVAQSAVCPLQSCDPTCDTVSQACDAASRCSRVRLMANRLQAQLDESSGSCRSSSASGTCQRVSAEHHLSQNSIDRVTARVQEQRDVPTAPHSGDPPSPPSLTSSWHPVR